MWTKKNAYYLQNGTATICKIHLGDKVIYELWDNGKLIARADNSKELIERHQHEMHTM
jgi:hypothetical protein